MFKRTRIAFQIVLTLFSFFGFNEAVLAVRYRTTIYISNFDARMAVAHTGIETPSFAGYASSGKDAYLAGDPGNMKFNESPLKLLEGSLKDLLKHSKLEKNSSTDLVIGIAGYDFYSRKPAPTSDKLTEYRYTQTQNCPVSSNRKDYFACMATALFRQHGIQVDSVKIVGDHTLMAASAQSWLQRNCKASRHFDLIQATTTAVPYQVRNGRIKPWSANLPEWLRMSGGYWDIGQSSQDAWFSPVPYSKNSYPAFIESQPVRQTLFASDYVQEYGQLKGDQYAMMKRWGRTGVNSLGYQASQIYNDHNRQDYLSGQNAVSQSTYDKARAQLKAVFHDVIEQLATIINLKQSEYYSGQNPEHPIVILGEFAADVLERKENRDLLLQSLPEEARCRVDIVPGDSFYENLSGGGLRILEKKR
ncbi:hypothetical protein [Endozoicomonas arenosclerae]|uniref:hypothetical protein n=1 Tax=Endozoicomonas arenosclerae TaxID=1633495 RepID=UPI000785DCCC|nr:hypothetical protein [Endozoicomonas arenosclerae]